MAECSFKIGDYIEEIAGPERIVVKIMPKDNLKIIDFEDKKYIGNMLYKPNFRKEIKESNNIFNNITKLYTSPMAKLLLGD